MSRDDDRRKRELAAIHVAKKQLNLSDDYYRALLLGVTGLDSCKLLSATQRQAVLSRFEELGWRSRNRGRRKRIRPGAARRRQVAKIRAMLHEQGLSDEYADGIARQMWRVDRYEWCRPDQLRGVIVALVRRGQRHGIDSR